MGRSGVKGRFNLESIEMLDAGRLCNAVSIDDGTICVQGVASMAQSVFPNRSKRLYVL